MPRTHTTVPSLQFLQFVARSNVPKSSARCLHNSCPRHANPLPVTATGPPPEPPRPAVSEYGEHIERKRRQAELLKQSQSLRAAQTSKPGAALKKRFWKDVSVQKTSEGHFTVNLDARPVRHPGTKSILPVPSSKPHLATAIALEWDLLVSAQQALKTHLIPLTSLTSRAYDLSLQDAGKQKGSAREDIVKSLMRYLDTDTLLCWAPSKSRYPEPAQSTGDPPKETLREIQMKTALPIISFLTTKVWPGVEIKPVLDEDSIVPVSQPQQTKDVIRGWISGLGSWELAALERAVLAGKSLCVAARLVVEWSENLASLRNDTAGERFGIEEAAEACSLEVNWQTQMWGEVEDTHDVDKEDVRRQFGSAVLLVSGTQQ